MKLKHIAAAAALVAVSAPSFAVLTLGNASNNPELVAVVLDRAAQVSYAIDLGVGLADFDQNGNYSYLLNSANFSSFLGLAGGAGGLEFSVYASENNGTTAAGNRNLLTTVNAGAATTPFTNSNVNASADNTTSYFGAVVNNSVGGTFVSAANGDGYASAGNTAYFLNSNSEAFNIPTLTWTTTNVEGTAAAFRKFSNSSTSNGAASTQTTLAGVWTFTQNVGGSSYTLQYSAVPDADGLALVLAGLGAMGFVARRRAAR